MQYFRAALFNILFFGWSVIYCTAVVFLLPAPRSITAPTARFWNRSILWLVKAVVGLGVEIRGAQNMPRRPAIYAVKHQSAWETIAFMALVPDPVYVLKRELLWIPAFGWYLARVGMIGIDRKAGPAALRTIVRNARRHIEAGRNIIIFPEGTRVPVGERRPFLPGVTALYSMLAVPVVPVALNSGVFWPRRAFMKRPGTIVVEFLPPIAPGLDRRAFLAELESRIETATRRLVAEARATPAP